MRPFVGRCAFWSRVGLTALAVACSSGDTAGPTVGVVTTVSVSPALAVPGDTVLVTVTAVPTGGALITLLRLAASGLITAQESVAVSGTGSQTLTRAFVLPYAPSSGTVTFDAMAVGPTVQATGQAVLAVADAAAPVVTGLSLSPVTSLEPGDTVVATITATDNAGIASVVLSFTGAFGSTDTLSGPIARAIGRARSIVIPGNARIGAPVTASVIVTDVAGRADTATAVAGALADLTVPVVTAAAADPDTLLVGDTIAISVTATDNHRVQWLGYRLEAPANVADSVPVAASGSASHTFRVSVPSAWTGTALGTVFARDSVGNRATAFTGFVTVYDATRRPTRSVAIGGAVRDLVHDARRGRLYLSQPDSNRVMSLATASMAFDVPIALPSRPSGLDLTVGGDSLVVALRRAVYLAVVDLTQASLTADTVRLNFSAGIGGRGPDMVRVAGNSKAIVHISFDGSGFGGSIVEYDLASRTQVVRTDVGINSSVTEITPMAVAGDRSRMLLLIDDSCCPEAGFTYEAGTNTFTSPRGTVNRYGPSVAADATGSRFLIANSLFDGGLNALLTFTPPDYGLGPSALSPDAAIAYLATEFGFLRVRTSDAAVLERVYLGSAPVRLLALADNRTLVAVSPARVHVVDLP